MQAGLTGQGILGILTQPDYIPIFLMVGFIGVFAWLSLRAPAPSQEK